MKNIPSKFKKVIKSFFESRRKKKFEEKIKREEAKENLESH